MYINPFVAGVLVTVTVEIGIALIGLIVSFVRFAKSNR